MIHPHFSFPLNHHQQPLQHHQSPSPTSHQSHHQSQPPHRPHHHRSPAPRHPCRSTPSLYHYQPRPLTHPPKYQTQHPSGPTPGTSQTLHTPYTVGEHSKPIKDGLTNKGQKPSRAQKLHHRPPTVVHLQG